MPIPDRLGRYVVRRRIGSGGFATVWLAYDEQLDAPVAVKVLAENWTEDHQVRTRFVEEGRYLRRVESPHVVTVYDAGELDDGRPYLVMTYADQGTLADRLQRGELTAAQAVEIVRQVGAGLQALHDRGILHRDVKPANVLFRTVDPVPDLVGHGDRPDRLDGLDGLGGRDADLGAPRGPVRAMVGDLGLGKALDVSSRLTMIAGTPSFVAPEQAGGESPDSRADQYSLGVLTFLLLSGHTPWKHTTLNSAADPAPMPALISGDLAFPEAVDGVVRRALSRDREERYRSVSAYVEALGAALDQVGDLDAFDANRWLPADPELTRPGLRPTPAPAARSTSAPATQATALTAADHPHGVPADVPDDVPADDSAGADSRRRAARPGGRRRVGGRMLIALAALVALAGGGVGGWFGWRALHPDVTLRDQQGALAVSVPRSWTTVTEAPWRPPGSGESKTTYAALSAGNAPGWQDSSAGEGVFIGVLPLRRLPTRLPGHPGCRQAASVLSGTRGSQTRSSLDTDCPGVLVEFVRQVRDNRVLWVQVRAADRASADQVIDSITVGGL